MQVKSLQPSVMKSLSFEWKWQLSEFQVCPSTLEPGRARTQVDSPQSPHSCHYLEQPDIEVDEVGVISLLAALPNEFGKVVTSDRSPMLLSQHREH